MENLFFTTKPAAGLALVCFILVLALSGCSAQGLEPDDNVSWQNEVLLASECGLDGLPCCPDQEQPCLYEQICCSDPSGSGRNRCQEQCTCGRFKEFCCLGETPCQTGLACRQSECVPCGRENEPCCDGEGQCDSDLICSLGLCLTCGFTGHPCCLDGQACAGQSEKNESRTECRDGICWPCGYEGQTACQSNPACIGHQLLSNGKCWQCGDYNQPCCEVAETGDKICAEEAGLVCRLGFCAKK